MHFEIPTDDAEFLHGQMQHQLDRLGYELVHTENSALKHALMGDYDRLQRLVDRLAPLTGDQGSVAAADPEY